MAQVESFSVESYLFTVLPFFMKRGSVIKVIAIAGSLRKVSTNKTLLKAAALLAPEGMEITLYDGIGQLPHFNPDLEYPDSVKAFQNQIKTADGLIISSPEYAHGVPGTLKKRFRLDGRQLENGKQAGGIDERLHPVSNRPGIAGGDT